MNRLVVTYDEQAITALSALAKFYSRSKPPSVLDDSYITNNIHTSPMQTDSPATIMLVKTAFLPVTIQFADRLVQTAGIAGFDLELVTLKLQTIGNDNTISVEFDSLNVTTLL